MVSNKISGMADDDMSEALIIVIDEGYHTHVALDFIVQMKHSVRIEPADGS